MTFLSNNMGISIGIMKEQWKQCCQLHMYNSGFHFFNFVISKFQQNFPTNFSLQKISQFPCPKKKPRKNQKKKKKTKIVKPKIWVYIENRFKCVCVCGHARVWGFLMQGWVSYTLPFRIHFGVWVWLILGSVMTRN